MVTHTVPAPPGRPASGGRARGGCEAGSQSTLDPAARASRADIQTGASAGPARGGGKSGDIDISGQVAACIFIQDQIVCRVGGQASHHLTTSPRSSSAENVKTVVTRKSLVFYTMYPKV